MSAGLIAFTLWAEPWAWTVLRILVGFCMSGIYVAAESWLNNATTNETRGKVLSTYMIAQTLGIIGAQGLLTLGDAATSALFIGASILVSISFAPILLSVTPAPAVEVAKPMSLRGLFVGSPLGTVGHFSCWAASMPRNRAWGAVFGSQIALSANQIALFRGDAVRGRPAAAIPDRLAVGPVRPAQGDLRHPPVMGALACGLGWLAGSGPDTLADWGLWPLMGAAFLAGGMTTPLYALLIAHANDFLSAEEMPAASGGLVFTFGLGAILGPLLAGWAMQGLGPYAFWLVLGATFAVMAAYAAWRMTRRATAPADETEAYLGVLPTSSVVAVEAAGTWAAEQAESDREAEAASA